jgi:uroporphyrinogen III methyltransferase/synthase
LLRERLLEHGAKEAREVAIYETRRAAQLPALFFERLEAGEVNWITFASSSTARNFIALLGEARRPLLAKLKIASIGPITSATLRQLGLAPTIESPVHDLDGLVMAIQSWRDRTGNIA